MATDTRPLWLKLSDANRAALADLGLLSVEAAPTATEGNAMTSTSTTSTTSATDQAAQLRAAEQAGEIRNAIEDTFSVFEAEPGAVRALEYLGALLAPTRKRAQPKSGASAR